MVHHYRGIRDRLIYMK